MTSTVLIYMSDCIDREELWCNNFTILMCGLSWLRNALSSSQEGIINFDDSEPPDMRDDNQLLGLFADIDWHYSDEYWRPNQVERNILTHPKLVSRMIMAVLYNAIDVVKNEAPQLSYLCNEVIALSGALHFLIMPCARNFQNITDMALPDHLQPKNLLNVVLSEERKKERDFQFVCANNEIYPLPFLVQRVSIACQNLRIKEANRLIMQQNSTQFWATFYERSHYWPWKDVTKISRDIIQCILLVFKAATSNDEELPEDFINFSIHLILSMNWLGACACSLSSVDEYASRFTVSIGNVLALHEASAASSSRNTDNSEPMMLVCKVIRCLSYCVSQWKDMNMYNAVQPLLPVA